MSILHDFFQTLQATFVDVLPIIVLITIFQLLVLRQPLPNPRRFAVGAVCFVVGLALFLVGLQKSLFPLGSLMAEQLSNPEFIHGAGVIVTEVDWSAYGWIYLFAVMIGFATAIAEPALIAVAYKAHEVSGGTINQWGLRIAVACGVAFGLGLGMFRIVSGTPLYMYILIGYVIVIIQTIFAPKNIIPLAYDSGGVSTSTVTVPVVAALGLGLASTVPGRNPAIDGFGLIAFTCLFPIITVMTYAQLMEWRTKRSKKKYKEDKYAI